MTRVTATLSRAKPALAVGLMMGLSACVFASHPQWASIKPLQTKTTARADDAYYESAVTAIYQRDYNKALELLQIARQHKADDIRVLNAFGVVYDELGRFDLSARYYADAKALDANSAIVANNIAHSEKMQESLAVNPSPATAAAVTLAQTSPFAPVAEGPAAAVPVIPVAAHALPAAAAPSLRVAFAEATPVSLPLTVPAPAAVPAPTPWGQQVGQPTIIRIAATAEPPPVIKLKKGPPPVTLVVVNAAAQVQGAQQVRSGLTKLGWDVASARSADAQPIAATRILYAPGQDAEARQLADTLPQKPKLVECDRSCGGLRLIVGMDSAEWTFTDHFALRHSDGEYAVFGRSLRARLG